VRTDMVLALVIFLIGLQIWNHIREQRDWDTRDRLLLFLLLTGAMLIKGPIVYAFIFPGLLIFVWTRRKIPTTACRCGWWPWIASLSIFLVWLGVGILIQHGFFHRVIMREFVSEAVLSASLRKIGEPVHRAQPMFFYISHLLHKFAPESADDRSFDCRSSFAEMEVARGSPANGARNLVVSVLEPRRFDRNVARSGKTGGPNLSRDSTVVPAARGPNRERLGE